jgi:hypothetical protein
MFQMKVQPLLFVHGNLTGPSSLNICVVDPGFSPDPDLDPDRILPENEAK